MGHGKSVGGNVFLVGKGGRDSKAYLSVGSVSRAYKRIVFLRRASKLGCWLTTTS